MITKKELIDTTLSAIIDSHETYLEWSGNEWLWNAPEYLLTVKIAEKLANINKNKFITLEDNVKKTLDNAGSKGQGKISSKIRANGRFDIVLWWAKGDPRAIIEVKHRVYKFANIEEDIIRIIETIKRKSSESSIKYGLVAFYMSEFYKNNAKDKLSNKINNLFKQTENIVSKNELSVEKHIEGIYCDNDQDVYSAIVFLIKR
ncbi:hypothetical protein [Aliarcobacter butzleri]|jgi:hypothetical protein|uniref:hypothetical protein n=1 Tax=Aliarcobacter butzleri TaxID=28197 RepID=UPI0021B5949D|nr:hypothetical protein [Aliarcobacter butzleri]MCT7579294.1 hypothetical protein [Aliarcobacter butzleri]